MNQCVFEPFVASDSVRGYKVVVLPVVFQEDLEYDLRQEFRMDRSE